MKNRLPILARVRDNERGIALVLSLFLMMLMSVLAGSLMFVSRSEVYASMNYRRMSEARYGAESGVHKTVNYLLNSYTPPGGAGDPLGAYDMTKSPVEYNGSPVILSANSAVASNYPIAATQTAFNAAAQGTLTAGRDTLSYAASAKLLSMLVTNGQTVQSWQITSDGSTSGAQPATVQVTSVLEKQLTPQANAVYGAFATNSGCGALTFSGQASSDSYDSTAALVSGNPVISQSGGNIGTNGNLNENNSAHVYGTLSTPRVGVGNCSAGNVDALSSSGGATVSGGVVHLSQAVTPPTPPVPAMPAHFNSNAITDVSGCPAGFGAACHGPHGNLILDPGSYNTSIHLTNDARVHLTAGTYNIDALMLDNSSDLVIDSGPVILNIIGSGNNPHPFDLNSSIENDPARPYDPTMFILNYAGNRSLTWGNHAVSVGQINAPNASIDVSSSAFYGSIIGNTVNFNNDADLHFDRHLSALAQAGSLQVGNDMLTSYTWKKY